jgi:hypothetical protein
VVAAAAAQETRRENGRCVTLHSEAMKATRAVSVTVFLGLAVACGVEVDIANKACPCGSGYVCDSLRNVCVKTGTPLTQPQATTTVTVTIPPVPVCDPCPCSADTDCTDATRPFCAPAGTGGAKICSECNPAADKCKEGTYCNAKFQCVSGCRDDDYCKAISPGTTCNVSRHQCVQCTTDPQCTGGQKCSGNGTCVNTCTPATAATACGPGQDCCGPTGAGLCIPVQTDVLNCGKCDNICPADNGTAQCAGGSCTETCADGFKTCGSGAACATSIRSDPANCGDCGKVCSATQVLNATGIICVQGKCSESGCKPGFVDANKNGQDGCEAPCGDLNEPCCSNNACNGNLNCHTGTPPTCQHGSNQQ